MAGAAASKALKRRENGEGGPDRLRGELQLCRGEQLLERPIKSRL